MSGESQGHSSLPVVSLIAIMAVTGGLFVFKPLQSSRPVDLIKKDMPAAVGVEARLWEDPLVAVQRHIETIKPDSTRPVFSPDRLLADAGKTLILPVMISAERNALSHESRIRSRYAVLSALGVNGYYPVDPTTVHYFGVNFSKNGSLQNDTDSFSENKTRHPFIPVSASTLKEDQRNTAIIPYEVCKKNDLEKNDLKKDDLKKDGFSKVVVLWVPDNAFEKDAVDKLKCLQDVMSGAKCQERATDGEGSDGSASAFRLIGPSRSDLLVDFLEYKDTALGFDVYSPWSTVHPSLLAGNKPISSTFQPETDRWELSYSSGDTNSSEDSKFTIQRMIPDDLALLKLIIKELELRGVSLDLDASTGDGSAGGGRKGNDSVIIISEWDRYYGRSMPVTFEVAWRLLQKEKKAVYLEKGAHTVPQDPVRSLFDKVQVKGLSPAIVQLSYMQGLDGLSLNTSSAIGQGREKSQDKTKSPGVAKARSFGPGQLDYIRRLADELARRGKHLSGDRDNVKAIGVLGSDVFDKLLLLQALRDIYPGVLFFTTDLDAVMLEPSEQKWARNLIVASGHGLDVEDKEKGPHLAPFRDTYMHAVFLACDRAVRNEQEFSPVQPRLFEIGRTRAIQLEPMPRSSPDFSRKYLAMVSWGILAVIALGLLLGRLRCDFSEQSLRQTIQQSLWLIGLPLGIFFLVLGILSLMKVNRAPFEEPFLFLEGVSIWPTELVRLFAALLSVYFILKIIFELRRNRAYLVQRFQLDGIKEVGRDKWTYVKGLLCFLFRTWPSPDGAPKVEVAWGTYMRLGRARNRVGRIALLLSVYLALSFLLFGILGRAEVPYRGEYSQMVDKLVLIMSVVFMLILVFFVVDATLLCRRFIQVLSSRHSQWPASSLEVARRDRGLEPDLAVEWLDIAIIARRTRTVGRFIVYPFIILFLMIISRNGFFDRWSWPLSLILVLGLNSTFAIMSAVVMRREAERARMRALRRLRNWHFLYLGQGEDTLASQASELIDEIRNLRVGAFAPLSQNPVFGAIIMPFGGISLAVLLEMLSGVG